MTATAADRASTPVAFAIPIPSGPGTPNISPATGLSTDYLNHFTEAVMALEMAGDIPECVDDLRAWRPKNYVEHFAASRFSNRDAVIGAYHAGDPASRAALDLMAASLNAAIEEIRDALPWPVIAADGEALARASDRAQAAARNDGRADQRHGARGRRGRAHKPKSMLCSAGESRPARLSRPPLSRRQRRHHP